MHCFRRSWKESLGSYKWIYECLVPEVLVNASVLEHVELLYSIRRLEAFVNGAARVLWRAIGLERPRNHAALSAEVDLVGIFGIVPEVRVQEMKCS